MSPLPRVRALRLVVIAAVFLAGAARAEPVVEYLTVEANEAGASGGHAALRLGARVYHFEAAEGRLLLSREPWADFRFRYRVLENRTVHAQRIDASPATAALLERHFDRRLWREAFERQRLGRAAAAGAGRPSTLVTSTFRPLTRTVLRSSTVPSCEDFRTICGLFLRNRAMWSHSSEIRYTR